MGLDYRRGVEAAIRFQESPAYRNYRAAIEGRGVTPLTIPKPPLPVVEKRDPPPAPPLVTAVSK